MANVNIRMDDATKKQFDAFCSEVGISVSAAFNLFAKRVVKEQRIPFEIRREVPNAQTVAAMGEYQEMRRNPEAYKRYSSFADAMSEVLADDV